MQPCFALLSAMATQVNPCQATQQYPGSFSQSFGASSSDVHPDPVGPQQPCSVSLTLNQPTRLCSASHSSVQPQLVPCSAKLNYGQPVPAMVSQPPSTILQCLLVSSHVHSGPALVIQPCSVMYRLSIAQPAPTKFIQSSNVHPAPALVSQPYPCSGSLIPSQSANPCLASPSNEQSFACSANHGHLAFISLFQPCSVNLRPDEEVQPCSVRPSNDQLQPLLCSANRGHVQLYSTMVIQPQPWSASHPDIFCNVLIFYLRFEPHIVFFV